MRNWTRRHMGSVSDLNWAAGFIDGEGHIYRTGSLRIRVNQGELGPLRRLKEIFPQSKKIKKYYQKHRPCDGVNCKRHSKGHPPCSGVGCKHAKVYRWDANGDAAARIMMRIYRFMWHKARKKQVRDALARRDPRFRCLKGHPYDLTFYESPSCSAHDVHYLSACPRCRSKGRPISSPGAIRCAPSKSSGDRHTAPRRRSVAS